MVLADSNWLGLLKATSLAPKGLLSLRAVLQFAGGRSRCGTVYLIACFNCRDARFEP